MGFVGRPDELWIVEPLEGKDAKRGTQAFDTKVKALQHLSAAGPSLITAWKVWPYAEPKLISRKFLRADRAATTA